jgi:hypothetical protein
VSVLHIVAVVVFVGLIVALATYAFGMNIYGLWRDSKRRRGGDITSVWRRRGRNS